MLIGCYISNTPCTTTEIYRYVPHQVEKLIDIYNGDEEFADKLNVFFDEGHYNHGTIILCQQQQI